VKAFFWAASVNGEEFKISKARVQITFHNRVPAFPPLPQKPRHEEGTLEPDE